MIAPSGFASPFTVGTPPAGPGVAAASRRFTVDGSPALERHLEHTRLEIRTALLHAFSPGAVTAILLGGGYGRGEGGVLRTTTGDRPYNDIECYVALHGPRRLNELRHAATLHQLAHALSIGAGLEVEFKILSLDEMRTAPVTMFSHDLVMGHRWVFGDDRLLAGCERHRKAELIPLAEATRLLLNRCSGLLFARELLERSAFTADDADFVGRNLAKARLALGDVVLTVFGRYHWSCRERHQRLGLLVREGTPLPEWSPRIHAHHHAGVEFKLHPQRRAAHAATLRRELEDLALAARAVWLWLESRRLGHAFQSPRDYALARVDKCPGTPALRNLVVNLLTLGPRAALSPHGMRYPRARLLATLPLLLWEPSFLHDRALVGTARAQLNTRAVSRAGFAHAYHHLWLRFR